MGRKRADDPKVPLTVSVRTSTKKHIREENINAGEILDNMFYKKNNDNGKSRKEND